MLLLSRFQTLDDAARQRTTPQQNENRESTTRNADAREHRFRMTYDEVAEPLGTLMFSLCLRVYSKSGLSSVMAPAPNPTLASQILAILDCSGLQPFLRLKQGRASIRRSSRRALDQSCARRLSCCVDRSNDSRKTARRVAASSVRSLSAMSAPAIKPTLSLST